MGRGLQPDEANVGDDLNQWVAYFKLYYFDGYTEIGYTPQGIIPGTDQVEIIFAYKKVLPKIFVRKLFLKT